MHQSGPVPAYGGESVSPPQSRVFAWEITVPEPHNPAPPLEMWGGLECTVNRVRDRFLDQMELNGHARRIEDLDRFAELGITAIRYPVLWERTAPDDPLSADWSWSDSRLARLRELGIRPIVGLVHHGSGPMGTDLLHPEFPAMLARYAGAVAERYPWVMDYTPVNEPLTTARFSALYGHWYPHRSDESSFFRAVLTQCQGVAAAMRAIRRVNPDARLIQTEDMGEIFARPELAAQAAYENERRWLSLDLLTGRVVPGHSFWERLMDAGITEAELRPLSEEPCSPDLVGINHYLTSERWLDERLERYPEWSHGGNGEQVYADIEAVRVCSDGPGGWKRLLQAAWDRYGLPLAATEVHLGCSREEQLRWVAEVWSTAQELRAEEVDFRAVTVWSLLGAFGWNQLVTKEGGDYEPGVFDLRAPTPRPTAIAHMVADLSSGKELTHPVLAVPGWWRRPSRYQYPPVDQWGMDVTPPDELEVPPEAPRILLVGGPGMLGDMFLERSSIRAIPCARLDAGRASAWAAGTLAAIALDRPWAVVLTMPPADIEPDDAAAVARACASSGIALLCCSPDASAPFEERGRTALLVEHVILDAHPGALIIWSEPLPGLQPGATPTPVQNVREVPTNTATSMHELVETSLDLLIDKEHGVWRLVAGKGQAWDCVAPVSMADASQAHPLGLAV